MFDRSKTRALVLLAAVFASGVVVGTAASAWAGHTPAPHAKGPEGMAAYLTDQLHLTAPQHDAVRAVFERHRGEMEAIWQKVHPEFDSLRTVIRGEVSAVLTPDQQVKYRALIADWERRHHAADSAAQTSGGKR